MWSFRHRVDIQRREPVLDSFGDVDAENWKTVAAAEPAAVEPLRGREFYAASQVSSDQPFKVVIRYRPDVTYTAQMRVLWEGRSLDVESAAEERAEGHFVHLHCRERLPQGFRA
jgi:SPP1 family predicted phage head-tail adaptor